MMYAFGNRPDFDVLDEPFYAAYLAQTGLDHPMRDAVLASGTTDPARVAQACARPGARYVYQKHMTHHQLPGFDQSWFRAVTHVFLIRHPARVLASYAQKRENPSLEDIGFVQQARLFDTVLSLGVTPIVVDSFQIRQAPEVMLRALCRALDVPFDKRMLRWPAGGHPADGVWAAHWYGAVHASTGFAGPEGPLPVLPKPLQAICDSALPHYTRLHALALKEAE